MEVPEKRTHLYIRRTETDMELRKVDSVKEYHPGREYGPMQTLNSTIESAAFIARRSWK